MNTNNSIKRTGSEIVAGNPKTTYISSTGKFFEKTFNFRKQK